ncbi:hypothetical protein [Kribbella sp. NPDC006257]|uniref:hypothetical protein n=1 Tax=Kribbella sp. NPDC006257 TaxID=3156738 RepID=UPI0033A01819
MTTDMQSGSPFDPSRLFTVPVLVGTVLMVVGAALIIVANNRRHFAVAPATLGRVAGKAKHVWRGGIALVVIGVVLIMGRWGSPSGADRIVLADTAGGLPKVSTPEWALRIPGVGKDTLVATYVHPKYLHVKPPMQPSLVYFYGLEGSYDAKSELKGLFDELTAKAPTVDGVHSYDAGPLGGLLQCASFAVSGQVQAHCFWGDSSTLGHLVAAELTEPEVAALLVKMRSDLEKLR